MSMLQALFVGLWFAAALLFGACATSAGNLEATPAAPVKKPEPQAISLAERLPVDTLIYSRLDPSQLLSESDTYLRFIDPELGREMASQAQRAWTSVRKMASNHGFAPKLLERLFDFPVHLVGLVQPWSGDDPKLGADGKPLDAFERSMGGKLCVALVLECGKPLAADFLEQFEAELERQAAENPDRGQWRWTQVETDVGKLIQLSDSELAVGHLDDYLVLASPVPRRLWEVLGHPPADGLANTDHYARFGQGDPAWFGFIDLRLIIASSNAAAERKFEQDMQRADTLDGLKGRALRQEAESSHQAYGIFTRLASLDKWVALGGRLEFEAETDRVRYGLRLGLVHGIPLSDALNMLLDGGRNFKLPGPGLGEGLALMGRLDLPDFYREVTGQLPEESRQQLAIGESVVQSSVGYSVSDLVALFSGDMYLFFDLVEAQAGGVPGGGMPDSGEVNSESKAPPRTDPKVTFLLGITDKQATERALSKIYEILSANQMFGPALSRRQYQGTDVFLVGPPGPEPERDPQQSLAVALLTQHLAFGSWAQVTGLVRLVDGHEPGAGDVLTDLVEGHREAGILGLLSHRLMKIFERQVVRAQDEPTVAELIRELRQLEIPMDGDPAEEDLRDALIKMLGISRELTSRSASLAEAGLVLVGRHLQGLYEWSMEAELSRK